MKITLIPLETEKQLLQRVDMLGHICYAPDYTVRELDQCLKFIKNIIKNRHLSVTEHAVFSFTIEDVSRSTTHQLVRHRMMSVSQQSQRYVKYDNVKYVTPKSFSIAYYEDNLDKDVKDEIKEIYEKCLANNTDTYKKLIELGVKKEDARYVLPEATCSKISITINLRSLINLWELRLDKHAQLEIQMMAYKMAKEIERVYPNLYEILKENVLDKINYSDYVKVGKMNSLSLRD